MVVHALRIVRQLGIRTTLHTAVQRLFRLRAAGYRRWEKLFVGKCGLEIGGPSSLFQRNHPFPIYPVLAELDNCLFAANTVWHPETRPGMNFRFDGGHRIGRQHICDGTDLRDIPAKRYDCVLSCNSLEHIANPLKALHEWKRVLADDGAMVVVVPAKESTFDHRRSVTDIKHLINDWKRDVAENDLSHVDEIVALHDMNRDYNFPREIDFREHCMRNSEHRCLHHHVFNADLIARVLEHVGLRVLAVERLMPHNIAAIAQKTAACPAIS